MKHKKENVIIRYWSKEPNWGDKAGPELARLILGYAPSLIDINETYTPERDTVVCLTIGSILSSADANTIVWGSGFLRENDLIKEKPKQIRAVRGPLSLKKIRDQGVTCPEVLGDPALLFPRFYTPKVARQFRIGLIPHYIDKNHPFIACAQSKGVKIIDPAGDFYQFLDDICSCEMIASSSLHGIIMADAYKIPSLWVKFSDNIKGGNFKFHDYFLSVGKEIEEPFHIVAETTIESLEKMLKLNKSIINLDKLMDACPFKK